MVHIQAAAAMRVEESGTAAMRVEESGTCVTGAVVVVFVWKLDLQLTVRSVHVTTIVVTSNPAKDEEYSIQYYVIKVCQ